MKLLMKLLATAVLALPAVIAMADAGHDADNDGADHAPMQIMLGKMDMDASRGRVLFAQKGCVLCHSVNGIGGKDAAPLDAHSMQELMNPFDLAAKMWAMAPYMIEAQEEELGAQILFTGQELGDIVAFLHDDAEQHKFTLDSLPENIGELLEGGHGHGGMPDNKDHMEDSKHD